MSTPTPISQTENLTHCVNYFTESEQLYQDTDTLLHILLDPTEEEKTQYNITNEDVIKNREVFLSWYYDHFYWTYYDWRAGLIVLSIVLLSVVVGVLIGYFSKDIKTNKY